MGGWRGGEEAGVVVDLSAVDAGRGLHCLTLNRGVGTETGQMWGCFS